MGSVTCRSQQEQPPHKHNKAISWVVAVVRVVRVVAAFTPPNLLNYAPGILPVWLRCLCDIVNI